MLYHLEQEPEVKQRLLQEIDSVLGPISDNLQEKFTREVADKLQFLKNCLTESIRIESPSSQIMGSFSEDVTIGGIKITQGDAIMIPNDYLHLDPNQW